MLFNIFVHSQGINDVSMAGYHQTPSQSSYIPHVLLGIITIVRTGHSHI
ncbi:MAG: hypothetical protein PWQ52_457 [Methanolobus sp.]|nr:hypothetical protein [Methanolobus sp.]